MRVLAILAVAALAQARPDYSSGGYSYSSGGGGGLDYTPSTSISLGGGGGGYSFSGGPIVTKHVYVHVAPEEPQEQRAVRINAPGQQRKHYKIVFIKAPSAPQAAGATVQLPQQDEEKTLIYVLHKKEEGQAEINFQQAPQTPITKPEVYFIKYRTQKGSAPAPAYGAPAAAAAPAAAPQSSYGAPSGGGGSY